MNLTFPFWIIKNLFKTSFIFIKIKRGSKEIRRAKEKDTNVKRTDSLSFFLNTYFNSESSLLFDLTMLRFEISDPS